MFSFYSFEFQNLKNLKLEFTTNFNCYNFFPKLENLVVLDISNSKANDIWLESIGTFCIHLRYHYKASTYYFSNMQLNKVVINNFYRQLFIQNCSAVTDSGIEGLFMSSIVNPQKVNFCKSIQVLSILQTGVSKKGIQMALLKCPALRVLNHSLLIDVLIENAQTALLELQEMPQYSLTLLTDFILSESLRKIGNLELAFGLCPLVTKVKIEFLTTIFTDVDLLCLKSLKKLREIKINCRTLFNQSYQNITFHGGVGPLLIEIGNSLEILNLSFISGINIWFIAESCPNLCSLTLNGNVNYITTERPSMNKKPIILKDLIHLCLFGAVSCTFPYRSNSLTFPHPIPREDLSLLLSSPLIVSLSICGCDTLTDKVLLNASKLHQFQNLNRLSIAYCNSFTSTGLVSVFLKETNPLSKIFIKSFATEEKNRMTRELKSLVATEVKKNNFRLHYWFITNSQNLSDNSDLNCSMYCNQDRVIMIHDLQDDERSWCFARTNISGQIYPFR